MNRSIILLSLLLFASPLFADDPKAPPTQVLSLAITPADEPSPALRYRFIPGESDLADGNAATFYYRAALMYRSLPEAFVKESLSKASDWLDVPADQFPREDVRKLLEGCRGILGELSRAARCSSCDWSFRLRDLRGPAVVEFLLPEMQELRNLARLLALQARSAILEKRFDDAVVSLGAGYKLSRDAAREPLLINGLIGLACAQMMNARLAEFSQAPGAPNLFWALSLLPTPLVDLQPAMGFEMSWIVQMFPVLKDVTTARRTAEQWDAELDTFLEALAGAIEPLGDDKTPRIGAIARKIALRAQVNARLAESRRKLVERGRKEADVQAMPDSQVILIDTVETYQSLRDEWFKWSFLPYPEAFSRMQATEERLKKEGWIGPMTKEPIPLASVLLPAVGRTKLSELRVQRTIAEARLIEALRMHAARNKGELPKSLDELTVVPPPNDPLTARPYAYRLEEGKAIISVAAPPGSSAGHPPKEYRITVREPAAP